MIRRALKWGYAGVTTCPAADLKEAAMETWDAIRARRNVRRYQTAPVPDAGLDRIAEAAWRAPSSRRR